MHVVGASPVAQRLKRLPGMQKTWVRSLGQEDPLEKEMATHSSTLAWKNPMEGGAWYATVHGVHGVAKSQTRMSNFTHSGMWWGRGYAGNLCTFLSMLL